MESLSLHQLPLAKFMFDRAEKEAVSNHPFSAGLAVSLLQDAVELGAAAACGQQGLKMPKAFLEFWKLPELGLVEFACMQRLNSARVGFKHLGNQPSRDAFIDFRAPALRVLDYISKRFFSRDFASVSLADGVANRKTREHLKRAEGYLAAGNSRDAVIEAARARDETSKILSRLAPRLPELEPRGRNSDPRWLVVSQHFNALRDFSLAGVLGVSLVDLRRSTSILPARLASPFTGDEQIQFTVSANNCGADIGSEDAEFVVRFVTDYALRVEAAVGIVPDRSPGAPAQDGL